MSHVSVQNRLKHSRSVAKKKQDLKYDMFWHISASVCQILFVSAWNIQNFKKCSAITFFIFKWLEAEFGTSAPSLKTNSKKCYNIAVFDTLKNIFIWNSAESLSNYSVLCSHTPYQHHGYTDTSCTLVVINRVSRTTAVNHFRHRWICL